MCPNFCAFYPAIITTTAPEGAADANNIWVNTRHVRTYNLSAVPSLGAYALRLHVDADPWTAYGDENA